MTREQFLQLHVDLTTEARDLMTRKNADYGATSDPFANFRMAASGHARDRGLGTRRLTFAGKFQRFSPLAGGSDGCPDG